MALIAGGCLAVVAGLVLWTLTTSRAPRNDGTIAPPQGSAIPAVAVKAGGSPEPDLLVAQPLPEFLKGSPAGSKPERAPAVVPPPPAAVRLSPIDASAAGLETGFLGALLTGKPDQALAATSPAFQQDGGIASLKSFSELAQERGGGTFTPSRTARLEGGGTAVVGQVVFGNGTKLKVTVLTNAGQVEGFTSVP
jgi:hypothetical protein